MGVTAVVGAQWGDEGKGKIVDWLSERADVIARFQGGHNAGHTLVIDGKVYKLHALPSGVVRGGKLSVIGNGVVLDPWHLLKEIETIRAQGVEITPETLMIAENTPLIMPYTASWTAPAKRPHQKGPKSAPPVAASDRAMRIKSAAAPSASPIWPIQPRLKAASTARCSTMIRCARVWASKPSTATG